MIGHFACCHGNRSLSGYFFSKFGFLCLFSRNVKFILLTFTFVHLFNSLVFVNLETNLDDFYGLRDIERFKMAVVNSK